MDRLPEGLKLDPATGRITGKAAVDGKELIKNGNDGKSTFPHVDSEGGLAYDVVLSARNARGSATKKLRIYIGDEICRTPPMGWNSWNCWAGSVDQDKVLRSARAMVASGLINHGWTYINIDDTWQGQRGGRFDGLQANDKFPDMKKLCDDIHGMGLKAGIYSTPWITLVRQVPRRLERRPQGHLDERDWPTRNTGGSASIRLPRTMSSSGRRGASTT